MWACKCACVCKCVGVWACKREACKTKGVEECRRVSLQARGRVSVWACGREGRVSVIDHSSQALKNSYCGRDRSSPITRGHYDATPCVDPSPLLLSLI